MNTRFDPIINVMIAIAVIILMLPYALVVR